MSLIWSLSAVIANVDGSWDSAEMRYDNSGYSEIGPDISHHQTVQLLLTEMGLTPPASVSNAGIDHLKYRFSAVHANSGISVLGDTESVAILSNNTQLMRDALYAEANFYREFFGTTPTTPVTPAADFPDVVGFTFAQNDNTDFIYNWSPFSSDRVIYLEYSWDGVVWFNFSFITSIEVGPYLETAWPLAGWPEAGHDFVPGHTYYLRARYQDVYPNPTLMGNFTVKSFVAV